MVAPMTRRCMLTSSSLGPTPAFLKPDDILGRTDEQKTSATSQVSFGWVGLFSTSRPIASRTRKEIWRLMRRIKHHRIREIMTPSPVTVSPKTGIRRLKSLFDKHDFNAFPVVDEHGLLKGIVSTLDILRLFRPSPGLYYPDLRALWAQHAEDVMRRGVVTVQPDDIVETAVKLLVQYRHRSLPVVDGRRGRLRLVGIVSRRDTLGSLVLEADDPQD
jgi:CBS domain-containing protein